jgi:RNA polymerase sigma-70 factor (ECF subfamily)
MEAGSLSLLGRLALRNLRPLNERMRQKERKSHPGTKCNALVHNGVPRFDDRMAVTLQTASEMTRPSGQSGPDPSRADQDQADVVRVLAGDLEAFAGIVRRWQRPLVNMAWRYCRDRQRAEEMAQEAFIRAWRGLAQWRGEGSFSTWLFALAANVYRSQLKRYPTVTVPMEEAPEPAAAASQYHAIWERERRDVLRRAVLALPPRYREPLVLFYFHEMDLEQAARTMGLPAGTMKARLSRARELLRRRFPHLEAERASMQLAEKEA